MKFEFFQLGHVNIAGHVPHADREIGALHLRGQSRIETFARPFVAQNAQLVLCTVSRDKKRETLDVVPVCVRDQQREIDPLVLEFLRQRQAKPANSAPRVEDDDFAIGADLHARRVASVFDRARAGCGNRAAHPPEFDARRLIRRQIRVLFGRGPGSRRHGRSAALPGLEHLYEVIALERFDEASVGADLDGVLLVRGVDTAGGDDDLRLLNRVGLVANGAANLEPIAARHAQVANHGVGLKLNRELDAPFAVAGFEHTPPGA